MKNKIFKASLFIIIATIIYYFIITSFNAGLFPKTAELPAPLADTTEKYSIEPDTRMKSKGKLTITIDDAEKEAFDFLNWLIASGLGMVTYAAKKGIDFGFIVLEGRIKKKNEV